MKKLPKDSGLNRISYTVERRDVKYPRIEMKTGDMVVIIPRNLNNERDVLGRNIGWVYSKYRFIQKMRSASKRNKNNMLLDKHFSVNNGKSFSIDTKNKSITIDKKNENHLSELKAHLKYMLSNEIQKQLNAYAQTLNVKCEKFQIRNHRTKWGSCSKNGNLSFNLSLVFLPTKLIKYIVFHELLHLKERYHNMRFWRMIEKEFKNYRNLEKTLLEYWFFLSNNQNTLFKILRGA